MLIYLRTHRESKVTDSQDAWFDAMRRGDLKAAWRITDRMERFRRKTERTDSFYWNENYLLWNGDPFQERIVAVRCNHGLGDTLQFVRFLPRLRQLAQRVILLAQPSLVPLLSGLSGVEVRNGWTNEDLPPGTLEIEVMELAYALRTSLDELCPQIPYIPHDHVRMKSRMPFLKWDRSLWHIGIFWNASSWDPARSVPLQEWAPLARRRDVRLYSLQQGAESASDASFPLEPIAKLTESVVDAAGALLELDLLITVDSMIAHLAGALGRPVWLILKQEADWRWMDDREESPWYPSMRIFRQKRQGDWKGVMVRVADALWQSWGLRPNERDENGD